MYFFLLFLPLPTQSVDQKWGKSYRLISFVHSIKILIHLLVFLYLLRRVCAITVREVAVGFPLVGPFRRLQKEQHTNGGVMLSMEYLGKLGLEYSITSVKQFGYFLICNSFITWFNLHHTCFKKSSIFLWYTIYLQISKYLFVTRIWMNDIWMNNPTYMIHMKAKDQAPKIYSPAFTHVSCTNSQVMMR